MKKLAISLLAAVLMTLGLTGVSTTAHADPYTNTVPTKAQPAKKTIKAGKKATFNVVTSGNAKPKGVATITCKKGKAKAKSSAKIKASGKVNGPKLKSKGKWKCTIKIDGAGVYKDSKSKVTIKVK